MTHDALEDTWLLDYREEYLAGFQRNQGRSNNCGEFAAAAALGLLFERPVSGLELADLADRGWLTRGLRSWPGGPTTPAQQARLAREYARRNGLALEACARKATLLEVRRWLGNPRLACLVTIAWDNRRPAKIMKNTGEASSIMKSPFFWSGHTMLLAAFRPGSEERDRSSDRWGFINSWADSSDDASIYWMENEEFVRCWGYPLFPIGGHNVVVIKRKDFHELHELFETHEKRKKTTSRRVG